jgi:cobyrinic acid a,c-diamide synthase
VTASAPGLIIAAPSSGAGKTTITLGLARALHRSGVRIATAKAGPDYIDPGFHAAATARPCLNLDVWAMRQETLRSLAAQLATGTELILCEGVMGLFDGVDGQGGGSTAALAALTGWPVVLVVDARGLAASAAAIVQGFATPPPSLARTGLRIGGVIFNRVGGESHVRLLRETMRRALPDLPVLGCVARDAAIGAPERHLGLVPAGEHPSLEAFLGRAAQAVSSVDLVALRQLARPAALSPTGVTAPVALVPPLGQRTAVARDTAFAFTYPAVLEAWRRAGTELSFFSPLADESPGDACDAVYLPGGYPELHAGRLAAAARFLQGLRRAAERQAAIYGECGGYMTLGAGLIDAGGVRHAMAGLLPVETSFARRRLHLGYRRATLAGDGPLGVTGTAYRGHEFHYATILDEGAGLPLFHLADASGRELAPGGRRSGSVAGSFLHLIDRADA